MKALALVLGFLSLSVFAETKCFDSVEEQYATINENRGYEFDYVIDKVYSLDQFTKKYDLFETKFEGNKYIVYQGNSEYMSGFGIDGLVVELDTCKVVDVVEVYAE